MADDDRRRRERDALARKLERARDALRRVRSILGHRRKCGRLTTDALRATSDAGLADPSVIYVEGLTSAQMERAVDRLTDAHPGVIFDVDYAACTLSAPSHIPESELREAVHRTMREPAPEDTTP